MNLTSPGCVPCSLWPCLNTYACIIKKDHDNRKCKVLLLSHCIIMSWRWVAQEGSIASGATGLLLRYVLRTVSFCLSPNWGSVQPLDFSLYAN